MLGSKLVVLGAIAAIGCVSPAQPRAQQGASIDAVADSDEGATIDQENRLFGVLIGGALGARGGYLIGAAPDWFVAPNRQASAHDAVMNAEIAPATIDDVHLSATADLNLDGFVTTDELIAMDRAGLSDDTMLARLRATNQVFELSGSQQRAMSQAGVSQRVIRELLEINHFELERGLGSRT
ncbi:MAG TPA: hypothetical protein VII72_07850 [Myxococcota bacterium]|jgi:hypothetical protein